MEWLLVSAMLGLAWWTWRAMRTGRKLERADENAQQLDAIESADQARRDADRVSDPVQQLRDNWRR